MKKKVFGSNQNRSPSISRMVRDIQTSVYSSPKAFRSFQSDNIALLTRLTSLVTRVPMITLPNMHRAARIRFSRIAFAFRFSRSTYLILSTFFAFFFGCAWRRPPYSIRAAATAAASENFGHGGVKGRDFSLGFESSEKTEGTLPEELESRPC